MKIAFKTFGCKANSVDTDALYGAARQRGFDIVGETEAADAYVINSCTVTSAADRDARHQAVRFKRQNPQALIGVVGCYAQVGKEELLGVPEVDFVVGTAEKHRILDLFASRWRGEQAARDQVSGSTGFLPTSFPGSRHARAAIKIQDGCNFSCSFCIIPEARGRSRSLPMGNILSQIDEAWEQGFQEITLTGIHLAHYGWDLDCDLMQLLERIFEKPEGPRVRVSTLDPFEIPEQLLAMLQTQPRLCPHFHIALQSGSDDVLSRMRRLYKGEEFVRITRDIERRRPDTFIGVDVIVGFPGEGEAEFRQTVDCLERSFWAKLHVFPFSLREGTRAETLDHRVDARAIHDRAEILRKLSEIRYRQFLSSQISSHRNVLLERPSTRDPGIWQGHTENYLPTLCRVQGAQSKQIVPSIVEKIAGERVWTSAR